LKFQFVTPVPKETCELRPIQVCTTEVVNYPSLELFNECVEVPKEVCAMERVNPRQVAKPVVRRWCPEGNKNVAIVTEAPGTWGEWTAWSECPKTCGANQTRQRECLDENDSCPDFEQGGIQTRSCPTDPACKLSFFQIWVILGLFFIFLVSMIPAHTI